VAAGLLEAVEDGGELLGEDEEAAVRGGLLVAEGVDESAGVEASGGDAGGEPGMIDFGEEAGDATPAGSFAGLTGITDEDDEEVEGVAGVVHHAVGSGADDVAEGSEELEQDGGRVGLGVRGEGADGVAGEAVESGFGQNWGGVGVGRN
jgi:hypothetical protein